jgi:hypothetical protein
MAPRPEQASTGEQAEADGRVGQLATSDAVETHRASPTLRLFIGLGVGAKLRGLRAYESQRGAIGKGLGRFLPC